MDFRSYDYIVGYGIGQYYDYLKPRIPSGIRFDFLCDARWKEIGAEYDGIKVISPEVLKTLRKAFVIVFSGNPRTWQSIAGMLDSMGLSYDHADRAIGIRKSISGRELKETGGVTFIPTAAATG